MADNSQPRWVLAVGSDPALREDFNQWADAHIAKHSRDCVEVAHDYASVLGYRYMIGELEALKSLVSWNAQEGARIQHANNVVENEGTTEGGRRRRRKRSG